MQRNQERIAMYSRKSRFTGKGESIGNQVDMCRGYIRTFFGDKYAEAAVVFEDEEVGWQDASDELPVLEEEPANTKDVEELVPNLEVDDGRVDLEIDALAIG